MDSAAQEAALEAEMAAYMDTKEKDTSKTDAIKNIQSILTPQDKIAN